MLTEVPGGINDAFDQLVDADYPVWTVQLDVSYPIGPSAADAAYARAQLQTPAGPGAATANWSSRSPPRSPTRSSRSGRSPGASRPPPPPRELAEEQLAAEQSRFEAGLSTNFFVVQAQRDLSAAQDTELRAILDQQKALIELDRVQRTSLSQAGIQIVQ